ncbi:MAG: hypothetical protein OEM32_11625, partial [Acidimicrobiia bacterium]|nr:hypothetical protein [Acidimicrobiia bacterium]
MPFWHGDMLGRPLETGRAVGKFVREISGLASEEAMAQLVTDYHLDQYAANNLVAYFEEEREATGTIPTDRTLVIERFRDEIGDWRVVLLSPLGARVHAPWAMALRHRFRQKYGTDVDAIWSDDGIAFRFPDSDEPPEGAELLLDPEDVETLLVEHIGDTALFGARFREAAGRSLLLPRRRPGERTPLWLQRRKASDLLGVTKRFGSFPIMLEVYREVLRDDFDLPALQGVLTDIRARKIRVAEVELTSPSPFASSLLFSFVAAYLYESDAPLAERRATALTLDRDLLRELLGDGELRELIDPDVLASVELELQHLTDNRRARHADAIHDMVRDLGPMSRDDILIRSGPDAPSQLERLLGESRLVPVTLGGEALIAAVEDMGRLRDALGAQPPPGIPFTYLEPVPDPLGDVVGRYARTHVPFTVNQAASALHLPSAVVESSLRVLESQGRVTRGSFLRGGTEQEWVDDNVLKRLKRRSLANLRKEIEPVDQERYAAFVPVWQGVSATPPRGVNALNTAIDSLQGAAIPASVLERDVLKARVADPAEQIDRLLLTGELMWVGRGPLGSRDGKVSVFKRDTMSTLWAGPDPEHEVDGVEKEIHSHLERHGASFFRDIYEAVGGGDIDEVSDALWNLVWAGYVTNDTMEPLRAFVGRRRSGGAGRRRLSARFPSHTSG